MGSAVSTVKVWFWYVGKSAENPDQAMWSGQMKQCNVLKLKLIASQQEVTHMKIEGALPANLDELAPNLTHLRITKLPKQDHHNLKRIQLLKKLTHLELFGNKLAEVPASIGKLTNLTYLSLSDNKLTKLPDSVGNLINLKHLDLESNEVLTELPASIALIEDLKKLDVNKCDQLRTPPKEVCNQGIYGIQIYFKNLKEGISTRSPAVTIAVMGAVKAGKTSLIRTLQSKEKKRVLTIRRPTGRDDATRVFNVEEVHTKDMTMRFVDVGGHEVYHVTYPLTFRNNCIPSVVVNMRMFYHYSCDKNIGSNEAARMLCFDPLSQLYIFNPALGSPILVLTHKDRFPDKKRYAKVRKDFLTTCEKIRRRVLSEYNKDERHSLGYMSNLDIPLFQEADIFDIGGKNDSYEEFENILRVFRSRCRGFVKVIPALWDMIADELSSVLGPYINFDHILGRTEYLNHANITSDGLVVILTYLHDCGRILWYPNVVELKPYVFQSIGVVTALLCVLFAHDDHSRWEERLADKATFFRSDGKHVENEEYEEMYQTFITTGIMNADLLLHLIKSESSFTTGEEIAAALAILRQFRLIYGPRKFKGGASFISPYFATDFLSTDLSSIDSPIRLHSQINVKGFAIPRYVYGQISLDILHILSNDLSEDTGGNEIYLARNGLSIQLGDLSIMFTHDFNSRKMGIDIVTEIDNISEGWMTKKKVVSAINFYTKTAWSAAVLETKTTCAHCLLTGDSHPKRVRSTAWFTDGNTSRSSRSFKTCDGKQIPACLVYPCNLVSGEDMERLKIYVDKVWVRRWNKDLNIIAGDPTALNFDHEDDETLIEGEQSSGNTSQLDLTNQISRLQLGIHSPEASSSLTYYPLEDCESPISSDDEGGFMDPEEEEGSSYDIRLSSLPTRKKSVTTLFHNNEKVYVMSKDKRGRALIINIERFNGPNALDITRHGSRVDVQNLSLMLEAFKFELAPVQENLTAQEILDVIKAEVTHEKHYNMFFMCIMTHGKEDNQILGSDQRTVKLKDVYELLSPNNFPAMAGKPKIIVVQACAGVKRDVGKTGLKLVDDRTKSPTLNPDPEQSTRPKIRYSGAQYRNTVSEQQPRNYVTDSPTEGGLINHLDVDDLLILKSSFENYASIRDEKRGSLLIRCLVVTLYRHASHRDLYSLFEIVQHRVRTVSKKLANKYPDHCFGQTAIVIKTLTRLRKVYLFPGYDPRSRITMERKNVHEYLI